MSGNELSWITSALTNEQAENAIVLCLSLKRAHTRCCVTVIASLQLERTLRIALENVFDITYFTEKENKTELMLSEDCEKTPGMGIFNIFSKCAYLPPKSVIMGNADYIFEGDGESDLDFIQTIESLKRSTDSVCLSSMSFLGNGKGPTIISLSEWIDPLQFATFGKLSLLEQRILAYWQNIYECNVKPLLGEEIVMGLSNQLPISSGSKEPIAIVGMSCRFPSCNGLTEFWNLLAEGKDGTSKPPLFRWTKEQSAGAREEFRETNAGFLPLPVEDFDANFFEVPPREAAIMDPQLRFLLEIVWEALEDACINPQSLRGSAGSVFLGCWNSDHKNIARDSEDLELFREYMNNSFGGMAGRIANWFGITGPTVAVENGCSSSMIAAHFACRSLQSYETNLAVVAGANLLLKPFDYNLIPSALSPDGRCKTFCENADGYARAEGCAVLVLKRMSDAVRDKDNVWAVIKGSAYSQEGMSNSLGTPTVNCESLAMTRALEDAQVNPDEVSYVEAHGTGTAVGDPVEVAAIAKAYRCRERRNALAIGSVKTNIGHTESCSGIAGIMKVVMAMLHQIIPPHRNFEKINPQINMGAVSITIPLEKLKWEAEQGKRRLAGVSSFGITGTDAHLILEENSNWNGDDIHQNMTRFNLAEYERPLHIVKVSAKTENGLLTLLNDLQQMVASNKESANFADIAYSGNIGRADFSHRAILIAKSKTELASKIQENRFLQGCAFTGMKKPICFLFSGYGTEHPGMARQLYKTSPVFRINFDICDELLKLRYDVSLGRALLESGHSGLLTDPAHGHIYLFCVQYALAKLWESWGVRPDYVLGHSSGEYAAAVCAGILSLEDAFILLDDGRQLWKKMPTGSMLAIRRNEADVASLLEEFTKNNPELILDCAAANSDEQTVVAGDPNAVVIFSELCMEQNIKCTVIPTQRALHCNYLKPFIGERKERFAREMGEGRRATSNTNCKFISAMYGTLVEPDQVDVEYWAEHLLRKVSFRDASKTAVELGCRNFIEIGPSSLLSTFTAKSSNEDLLCLGSLKRGQDDWTALLNSLGRLYLEGVSVDWLGFDRYYNRTKIRDLPHYPFQRMKYWIKRNVSDHIPDHSLLGNRIFDKPTLNIFEPKLSLNTHTYIQDHVIGKNIVFPGAGFLEICLEAGMQSLRPSTNFLENLVGPLVIKNLFITAPLSLQHSEEVIVQTVADVQSTDKTSHICVQIFQRVDSKSTSSSWLAHAKATVSEMINTETEHQLNNEDISEGFSKRFDEKFNREISLEFYEKMASAGLNFGDSFRSLQNVWMKHDGSCLLASVAMPKGGSGETRHILHPILSDALLQTIVMLRIGNKIQSKITVPAKVGKFIWFGTNTTDEIFIYAFRSKCEKNMEFESTSITAVLLDGNGHLLAVMSDVVLVDTTARAMEAIVEQHSATIPEMWEEMWRPQPGAMKNRLKVNFSNFYDGEFSSKMSRRYGTPGNDTNEIICRLDKLVYYSILRFLYENNLEGSLTLESILSHKEISMKLGIDEQFKKLLLFYLDVLCEEDVLQRDNSSPETFRVIRNAPTLSEISEFLCNAEWLKELENKFLPTGLFLKLGSSLNQILKGKESLLSILFPEWSGNDSEVITANHFYEDYYKMLGVHSQYADVMQEWLCNCQNEQIEPFVLRILEVGAGTGSLTQVLLELLGSLGVQFEYTYTDISPAFFTSAKIKFEKWEKSLIFRKLNIEEDPISQGYVPEYYDYICALDVIHATKNVHESLKNLHILLRQNGRLDLMEMTRKNRITTFLFGTLDGFWRFDDSNLRTDHCTLSVEEWKRAANETGFEVESVFSCLNESKNAHSMICCKRLEKFNQQPIEISANEKLWILFRQEGCPISKFLHEKIRKVFARNVITIQPGDSLKISKEFGMIRRNSEEDFQLLMKTFQRRNCVIEGILYCWTLDSATSQDDIQQPFMYLTKSILNLKQEVLPRLIALFEGMVPTEGSDFKSLSSSTVWGFVKSLCNEVPDMNCRCVDIGDSRKREDGMMQIFYEIWNQEAKFSHVAYTEGARRVPMLQRHKQHLKELALPSGTDRFQLAPLETNSIDDLQFQYLDIVTLEENEVEVQVKANALNFLDILTILKPPELGKRSDIGKDISGVITHVGKNVSKWSAGDRVCAFSFSGALPSHLRMNENDVYSIPDDINFCDSATLPVAFTTIYFCFVEVANLKPSDTVLIHTASGGVGLCAVQYCQYIGANIICTAGSKRKRSYLRSLGIENIFNSRNTKYGKKILEVTEGRGVDVVLNSLTSEGFKEATLQACGRGARFIEMSKISIWSPAEVKKLRPDVEYTVVDILSMSRNDFRGVLGNLPRWLLERKIKPLPYVRFDAVNIQEALLYLQKAKHIGKIVCVMPEVTLGAGHYLVDTPLFHSEATYLVTGGLGGIGFEVCRWMLAKGARFVVLAGRSSPSEDMQQSIRELNFKYSASVLAVRLDVSDFSQCRNFIRERIPKMGYPPLRGIMHCAGTLRDGFIQNQSWHEFASTLMPKVDGTLNLHELTKELNLEHFVLFSSMAALIGPPGQSNHAAGNSFEDAFAHYRRSIGLPALTINWGQWIDVGVATESETPGIRSFTSVQGIAALEYLMKSQRCQAAVCNFDSFPLLFSRFPNAAKYFDESVMKPGGSKPYTSVPTNRNSNLCEFWEKYNSKQDNSGRAQVVKEEVNEMLRNILKLEQSAVIGDDQCLHEIGIDSLMIIELKNAIKSLFEAKPEMKPVIVRDTSSVRSLSEDLLKEILALN